MDFTYPQASMPGATPSFAAPPKKDKHKLLQLVLIVGAGLLLVLVIAAIVWALLPKKKAVVTPPLKTVSTYYYVDSHTSNGHTKDSYAYTIAVANPASGNITKNNLTTAWPLAGGAKALQFSKTGAKYLAAINDAATPGDPYTPTPNSFQLVVGTWPQHNEKVIVKDQAWNDYRDWLLTADGKEVLYIDSVLNDKKQIVSQTLYRIDAVSGESTKVGAVNRPIDHENSPLLEVAKDHTVRFYTSLPDGIYETRYNRTTHALTNTKVVIKNYDNGSMGAPSPDGTKMIFFGSNPPAGDATLYLFDLKAGGVTPMLKTPAKYGGYSGGYWSPDSKLVLIANQAQDVDGAHTKNQFLTVDTTVKATRTQVLLESTSPGADNSKSFYTPTGWSADGRYLTFLQNNQLQFYDLEQYKTLSTVKVGHDIDPTLNTIRGWLAKVE